MLKTKSNRECKLQSHSISNWKAKKLCDQFSVKPFLNTGLLKNKGKLTQRQGDILVLGEM